jgi:uracil-DNA glycosylase
MKVNIEASWAKVLAPLFEKDYFKHISTHLKTEIALHRSIYPKGSLIFNAFEKTPFDKILIIILVRQWD